MIHNRQMLSVREQCDILRIFPTDRQCKFLRQLSILPGSIENIATELSPAVEVNRYSPSGDIVMAALAVMRRIQLIGQRFY